MPSLRGLKVCETTVGPGIAKDGSFEDPRSIPSGPLPKDWGAYHGYTLHGDRVVIDYEIGGMQVREAHAIEGAGGAKAIARELELGPCRDDRWLVLADAPDNAKLIDGALSSEQKAAAIATAVLQWVPVQSDLVELGASTTTWDHFAVGGPSANDYLDSKSGTGATVRFVPGFSRPYKAKPLGKDEQDSDATTAMPALHDGAAATSPTDWQRGVVFESKGDRSEGRYIVDLQKAVSVSRVSSYSWGNGDQIGRAHV